MERIERRILGRVPYESRGVVVVCDTQQVIDVGVRDIGPIGVGIIVPAEAPRLVGKDLILITDTVIMYADMIRQDPREDGDWDAGLSARKFSPDVLQYLFDSIELKSKYEEVKSNEG